MTGVPTCAIPICTAWLTHHLKNWMGETGFLHKASCKSGRRVPEGEMLFSKGKVVRKYVQDGKSMVAIEQVAHNQDDELSVIGGGTIILPTRQARP